MARNSVVGATARHVLVVSEGPRLSASTLLSRSYASLHERGTESIGRWVMPSGPMPAPSQPYPIVVVSRRERLCDRPAVSVPITAERHPP